MCDWVTLLYNRNWHSVVDQPQFLKIKKNKIDTEAGGHQNVGIIISKEVHISYSPGAGPAFLGLAVHHVESV